VLLLLLLPAVLPRLLALVLLALFVVPLLLLRARMGDVTIELPRSAI
jgi:hypothetical protein